MLLLPAKTLLSMLSSGKYTVKTEASEAQDAAEKMGKDSKKKGGGFFDSFKSGANEVANYS